MLSPYRAPLLLLLCFALPAWADKAIAPDSLPGTIRVGAEETIALIQNEPNLVIIDSRRNDEHLKGHIAGSVSLLDAEMTADKLAGHAPDKNTPLLFYCNGERCLRSSNAASQAVAWGYRRVYWFRGGWQEWIEKELPVAK